MRLLAILIFFFPFAARAQKIMPIRRLTTHLDTTEFRNVGSWGKPGPHVRFWTDSSFFWDLNLFDTSFVQVGRRAVQCYQRDLTNSDTGKLTYDFFVFDSADHKRMYKFERVTISGRTGKLDGGDDFFSLDGSLVYSQSYRQDTLLNRLDFSPNGKISLIRDYSKCPTIKGDTSRSNGIVAYLHPNLMQWCQLIWKDGLLWGVKGNWNNKGERQDPGTLKDGTGTLIFYNEDGSFLKKYYYKDGILQNE